MNPNRDEVNAELARVLRSRAFARSQRARDLLLYLVSSLHDGGTTRLKESVIALDVFGRDAATYDSTNDGIVRVSVNRLRELLDRYYGDEGRSNGLRIEIQRGGYVPIVRRNTPAGLLAKPRIAVLPLANFTGRSDEDALCDGLSEDIIDAMTRLPDVRVIARTSSFRYKNANRDVREIATELAVDALLEGSVQLDGAQLKVTAQLVLGSDGSHQWSHVFTFARDERHVLLDALIDLMLRSLTLGAVADAPHVVARNTAPQVQGLIDQARGLNVTQTPENLALAEAMATRATELDPQHADAWFVLAMVRYSRRSVLSSEPTLDQGDAEAALEQAIALDPGSAQARSLSAYTTICNQRQWALGLARAQEAVALAPNHGGVNARLGFIYLSLGRFADATAIYEHVLTLDPLAPPARYHHALTLMVGDRLAESRRAIDDARRLLGESAFYFDTLCTWLELAGEHAQSLRTAELALQRFPTAAQLVFHAGFAEARLGDLSAARTRYPQFSRLRDGARHFAIACVESGGADDAAFFEHVRAVAVPTEPLQLLLPCQPAFRRHHGDPRWQALLAAMNYPAAP